MKLSSFLRNPGFYVYPYNSITAAPSALKRFCKNPVIRPLSARSRPISILRSVVFPAPDGAMIQVIRPSSISILRLSRTVFPSKVFVIFSILILQKRSSKHAALLIRYNTSFSNVRLNATMTSVHANKSGVSRYTFACCRRSPTEPRGIPITSAATPAFQHSPSEILHAV